MFFYIDSNYKIWGRVNHFHFKRGDDLELTLIFIGKKGYTITPEFVDIVFAAKLPGSYDGEFMAYTNTFIPAQTAEGDPCMKGTLRLNSVELASKIGSDDSIELAAEFEFNKQGEKSSSQTISLFVHNDLIKGMEGIPEGIIPDYVTKSYVDVTVSGRVSEAFEKNVLELASLREESSRFKDAAEDALAKTLESTADSSVNASLARKKAEEASKNQEASFSYKNEASSSALSAVHSARDAADSASGIIQFVERAENSATTADNCAQAVQNIQQIIAGQFEEIQEKCLLAQSSSIAAQESSAQAAISAQSLSTGVLLVQSVQGNVAQAEGRILASESRVASHVVEAGRCASAAEVSESNATTASLASEKSAQSASLDALRAEGFSLNAEQSAQSASRSELSAGTKANEAAQSAAAAKIVAEDITLDWDEINQALILAQQSSASASFQAADALVSAGKAKTSEDNTKSAESNAAASKLAAAGSATTAAGNASSAEISATEALASASTAASQAMSASEKALAAAGSAVAAAGSARDSAGSATNALSAQSATEAARERAESAALRAESAAEDSITQGEVDTTLSLHNEQESAHSLQFFKKLDVPEGGVAGQILTKTVAGTAWGDAPAGGGSFDPVDSYTFTGDNTFTGGVTISTSSSSKPALKISVRDNISLTVQEGNGDLSFLVDGRMQINSAPVPLKEAGTLGINIPLTLSGALTINNSEKTRLVSSSTQIILGGSNGAVNRLDFSVSHNTSLDFSVFGEIRGPNNTLIAGLRMLPKSYDIENKGFSWQWTEDKYSLVNMAMLNYLTVKKPYTDGEVGQVLSMGELEPEWINPPSTTKIYHIKGIVDDLYDKDVPNGIYKVTLMMKKKSALYPILLDPVDVYGANCFGICETGIYYTFTDFKYGAWMNSVGDQSVQPVEFDYISGTFFWKKVEPGIMGLADYGGDSDITLFLEYICEDFLIV